MMLFLLRLLESALQHLLKFITEMKIIAPSLIDVFNDYMKLRSLINFTITYYSRM